MCCLRQFSQIFCSTSFVWVRHDSGGTLFKSQRYPSMFSNYPFVKDHYHGNLWYREKYLNLPCDYLVHNPHVFSGRSLQSTSYTHGELHLPGDYSRRCTSSLSVCLFYLPPTYLPPSYATFISSSPICSSAMQPLLIDLNYKTTSRLLPEMSNCVHHR